MKSLAIVLVAVALTGCAGGNAPLKTPSVPAAGAQGPDWEHAGVVTVVLDNFSFEPAEVAFEANHAYRLHLENRGSGGHNFDAAQFFRSTALKDGAAADKLRTAGGVVELGAGDTADILLDPLTPGTYPLKCSHPFHAALGMTGSIVVR